MLESQRLQEDHLRLAARGLSERQALLFAKKRTNRLDLMMSLIDSPQDKQAVWNRLILSRASILDESSERARRWRREPDPEAAAIWDELTQARTNLAALVIHGPSESSHDFLSKVEQARTVKEQLERNLAERSQSFRGELERDRAGLADVQSKLPVKSAVVAYFAAENLYAFITGADGEVHTQTLGSTASINKLVAAWRKEINRERDSIGRNAAKNEQSYRAASAALRKAVWDPVSRYAGKAELVFLVPDGQLQIVNFASLAVGDSAYLAERGPVLHILTTERDLIQPALPPQQVTKTVLAVGNPAYDTKAAPQMLAKRFRGAVSTCSDFQSLRFEALPASGREAEVVTAISKRQGLTTTLLTGAGATESAVKETIRGQRIVHIATHGFFLDQACRNNPAAQENPLLRAGLVFSGCIGALPQHWQLHQIFFQPGCVDSSCRQSCNAHEGNNIFRLRVSQHTFEIGMCIAFLGDGKRCADLHGTGTQREQRTHLIR